jgi:hypothetical protein
MRKYAIKRLKALQSCAFFVLSKERKRKKERERAREREMERKRRKRGQKNTTSLLKFFESPPRKKKDQKHKSERRVLSPVTEKTTKKTIHIGF